MARMLMLERVAGRAGKGFDNSSFPTFAEAFAYARLWLGEYENLPENWDGSPYDYSGYGDLIEIKQV
jgi:hypothetical protein